MGALSAVPVTSLCFQATLQPVESDGQPWTACALPQGSFPAALPPPHPTGVYSELPCPYLQIQLPMSPCLTLPGQGGSSPSFRFSKCPESLVLHSSSRTTWKISLPGPGQWTCWTNITESTSDEVQDGGTFVYVCGKTKQKTHKFTLFTTLKECSTVLLTMRIVVQ